MILFQDNKEKQGDSPAGTLDNFKDIKSVGSPSAEKVKSFWDKLFGSMVNELIKTYSVIKGAEVLFPSGRDVIGKCPRCGGDVTESKKGFFCERNECRFGLWRDNKFLTGKKINLTKKMVGTLLKDGRIPVKGIFSEKTGKSYDATLVMTDDGAKTLYSLDFGK